MKKPDISQHKHKVCFVSLLVIIAGTVLCNFKIFVGSEFSSKWYWAITTISLCSFVSVFYIRGQHYRYDKTVCTVLFMLLIYCLTNVVLGPFVVQFCLYVIFIILLFNLGSWLNWDKMFDYLSYVMGIIACILALFGILQYCNILQSNDYFKVQGSFDNPAGFASALAFCNVFLLYNTVNQNLIIRYFARVSYAIVLLAIILSGSRAGLIVVIVTTIVYLMKLHRLSLHSLSMGKKILIIIILILGGIILYGIKKDSADGRLIIWQCTWDMIKDQPLFGHGYRSFQSEYMLHQAQYFTLHPHSRYAMLADNVKHPFNEFILLFSEFGLMSLVLVMLLSISIFKSYLRHKDNQSDVFMITLLGIVIFSFFSYPFQYPFTWIMICLSISYLSLHTQQRPVWKLYNYISKSIIVVLSSVILLWVVRDIYHQYRWYQITQQNTTENSIKIIEDYETLLPYFQCNPYFLYNYSGTLNYIEEFQTSAAIIDVCEHLMNDYDVQMLKADNQKKLGNIQEAQNCYMLASYMCPSKFMPLYELVLLYEQCGEVEKAIQLAEKIIAKPVKIESGAVKAIKNRMRKKIGELQNVDIAK